MDDDGRFGRFLRTKVRAAGRRYELARQAYAEARDETLAAELPTDGRGQARIVCRRFGERRRKPIDEAGRPSCFEAGHRDCEGCREDILTGRIETW